MISRLSATAAVFAIFATAGIAFAADVQLQHTAPARAAAAAEAMPVVVLPRVEVTGHRRAQNVHF